MGERRGAGPLAAACLAAYLPFAGSRGHEADREVVIYTLLDQVIFNQGYNNALDDARPKLYTKAFQAMIRTWRKTFGDESLPFGTVEYTAGGEPQTLENFELRMVHPAPHIREAQFKAYLQFEHIGFARAYDQQVPPYHPHKKVPFGERIARWSLDTQYGIRLGWRPAVCTKGRTTGSC